MKFLTKDCVAAITVMLFSVAGYLYCGANTLPGEGEIGSMYTPKLLCLCLLVLGVLKFIGALREAGAQNGASAKKATPDRRMLLTGVGTIVLIGLYCFLFRTLGFVIVTFFYLLGQMTLFCPNVKKLWWVIILIAALSTAVMFLIFSVAFGLMLPLGPLEELLAF